MGGVKSEVGGVRGEDKGIKDVHERENKKVSISTVLCPARAHRRRRKHTTHTTHRERERDSLWSATYVEEIEKCPDGDDDRVG